MLLRLLPVQSTQISIENLKTYTALPTWEEAYRKNHLQLVTPLSSNQHGEADQTRTFVISHFWCDCPDVAPGQDQGAVEKSPNLRHLINPTHKKQFKFGKQPDDDVGSKLIFLQSLKKIMKMEGEEEDWWVWMDVFSIPPPEMVRRRGQFGRSQTDTIDVRDYPKTRLFDQDPKVIKMYFDHFQGALNVCNRFIPIVPYYNTGDENCKECLRGTDRYKVGYRSLRVCNALLWC